MKKLPQICEFRISKRMRMILIYDILCNLENSVLNPYTSIKVNSETSRVLRIIQSL